MKKPTKKKSAAKSVLALSRFIATKMVQVRPVPKQNIAKDTNGSDMIEYALLVGFLIFCAGAFGFPVVAKEFSALAASANGWKALADSPGW